MIICYHSEDTRNSSQCAFVPEVSTCHNLIIHLHPLAKDVYGLGH